MEYADARNTILAEFLDKWDEETSLCVVDYGDSTFTTPTDGSAWLRVTALFYDGSQASLAGEGDRLFRRYGTVVIQVFTSPGNSSYGYMNKNDELAQLALNIFDGKSLSGIWFRDGGIKTIGVDPYGWYQQNVQIDFIFDEVK